MAKVIHFKGMDGAAWNGPVVEKNDADNFVERYVKRAELEIPIKALRLQSPNGTVFLLSVTDDGELSIKGDDADGS